MRLSNKEFPLFYPDLYLFHFLFHFFRNPLQQPSETEKTCNNSIYIRSIDPPFSKHIRNAIKIVQKMDFRHKIPLRRRIIGIVDILIIAHFG